MNASIGKGAAGGVPDRRRPSALVTDYNMGRL